MPVLDATGTEWDSRSHPPPQEAFWRPCQPTDTQKWGGRWGSMWSSLRCIPLSQYLAFMFDLDSKRPEASIFTPPSALNYLCNTTHQHRSADIQGTAICTCIVRLHTFLHVHTPGSTQACATYVIYLFVSLCRQPTISGGHDTTTAAASSPGPSTRPPPAIHPQWVPNAAATSHGELCFIVALPPAPCLSEFCSPFPLLQRRTKQDIILRV